MGASGRLSTRREEGPGLCRGGLLDRAGLPGQADLELKLKKEPASERASERKPGTQERIEEYDPAEDTLSYSDSFIKSNQDLIIRASCTN
jgi:hypothetical protein